MTRAKPWRQSGRTVSWSVSRSFFKKTLKSFWSPQSPLFAFLWGRRLGHWPAGWQAQTCDAICARRGGACGFAQTLCSFQFKQKMEKIRKKMWKMNGKDAMQQYRIHMNGLNKWFWRQNMASLRQWSGSQSFYVFGALVIVLGLESLYIQPWMVNQGDESAKWKGVRGPMFKKFLATARIS